MGSVRAWLGANNLSRYADAFEEQGFDCLDELLQLSAEEAHEAAHIIGLLPGHRKRFWDALSQGSNPATASNQQELSNESKEPNTTPSVCLGEASGLGVNIQEQNPLNDSTFNLGDDVVVHSLVRSPDLNGLHGKVTNFSDSRAHVDFGWPFGTKAVLCANLRHAHTSASSKCGPQRRPNRWNRKRDSLATGTGGAAASAVSAPDSEATESEVMLTPEFVSAEQNTQQNAGEHSEWSHHDQHWDDWNGAWWYQSNHWEGDDGGWQSRHDWSEDPQKRPGKDCYWAWLHVPDLPDDVRVEEFLAACQDAGVEVDPSQQVSISHYKRRAKRSNSEAYVALPSASDAAPPPSTTQDPPPGGDWAQLPSEPFADPWNVDCPVALEASHASAQIAAEPKVIIRTKPGCYIRSLRVKAQDCSKLIDRKKKVVLRGQKVKFSVPTYKPSACIVEDEASDEASMGTTHPTVDQLALVAALPTPHPDELMALLPPPPPPPPSPSPPPPPPSPGSPYWTKSPPRLPASRMLSDSLPASPPEASARTSHSAAALGRLRSAMVTPPFAPPRHHGRQPRQVPTSLMDTTWADPYGPGAMVCDPWASAKAQGAPPAFTEARSPHGSGAIAPAGLFHEANDRWSPMKTIALADFDPTQYNADPRTNGFEYLRLACGETVYIGYVPDLDQGWVKVTKLHPLTHAPLVRGWVPSTYIELQ